MPDTMTTARPAPDRQKMLQDLDRLSTLLDSKFRVPGTSIRFGLDGILGLIPGVGDLVTAGPAAYLLYRGYQMGARKRTMTKMAVNAGIDLTVGAIPVVGDLFDVFFKANRRNVALLRRELERDDPQVRGV